MRFRILAGALAIAVAGGACTPKGPALSPLAERGRQVYQTTCIACHNADPKKPGALGPDIAGSSLELITARVMKAEYPPGYAPKRQTHTMTPIPQVKEDLPAIAEYLATFK
jgi:mono/diheme cytochrome c family protein